MSLAVQRESKIFVSIEEAFKATARLQRLITFENSLSGAINAEKKRKGFIEKIISVWEAFMKSNQPAISARLDPAKLVSEMLQSVALNLHRPDEFGVPVEIVDNELGFEELEFKQKKQGLIGAFTACSQGSPFSRTLPRSLSDQMVSIISLVENINQLQLVYDRVMKDCSTLKISSNPVNKSAVGKRGPTLLVGYSNPGQLKNSLVAYVLKWTDKKETAGYMVYEAFLSQLRSSTFLVPQNGWYDFEKRLYLDATGRLQGLDGKTAVDLKKAFDEVPGLLDPSIEVHGNQVMVMERIQGENLAEFAAVKYKDLNEEQKNIFFYELGKLTVLDLLLGNTDRLIRFKEISDDCSELEFSLKEGANLGNLMFAQQNDGNYSIHLIDNAVDDDFITNCANRKKYLEFIQSLFSQEDVEIFLSASLVTSLDFGFKYIMDDHGIHTDKVKEIREDLKTFAREPIERGMVDMMKRLQKIAPVWNNGRADVLKEQLLPIYPEFLDTLEERIPVFNACMKALKDSWGGFSEETSLVYSV